MLIYLNVGSPIRRTVMYRIEGVTLLKDVWHWGGFELSKVYTIFSKLSLPVALGCISRFKLSAPIPPQCLPSCCNALPHNAYGHTLWNY